MTYQRRRSKEEVKIWKAVPTQDNRGATFWNVPVDADDTPLAVPITLRVAIIGDRSSIASLPGQQVIQQYLMLVDADVDCSEFSRVLWRGDYYDVAAPPQLHPGSSRSVQHQTVSLRRRPKQSKGFGPSTYPGSV